MPMLSESNAKQVSEMFGALDRDVEVRLYTQVLNCEGCRDTERILAELAVLSDRIRLRTLNSITDPGAAQDGIEHVPAIVVSDGTHSRVRLYGTPSGYEFTTLLTAIVDAGTGQSGLEQATEDFLERLGTDLHVRVFVTPTCPYCPKAAVLALRMAARSPRVRAEVVEANEFPELSMRFGVQGVPRTVVNDTMYAEGALPESALVKALEAALADPDGASVERNLAIYLREDGSK
jgi:glutaredoxin-like protein